MSVPKAAALTAHSFKKVEPRHFVSCARSKGLSIPDELNFEDSKRDWDPINTWLLELRFAGIATMLMHHTNKEGGQRGTSRREDNLDCSVILKNPPDYTSDDGCRFVASFTKARVGLAGLSLIEDAEFRLIQDEAGAYAWTWGNLKRENRRAVLEMIDEGADQKTIYETLNLSKGYVSKIINKAKGKDGITARGF